MRIETITAGTKAEPRPYQRVVVQDTTDMFRGQYRNAGNQLEGAIQSVLVESPTGSGKTVMGHMIAKLMQAVVPDLTIGWVAMRRNLLTQARDENARLGLNVENIHYVSMFDKHPDELIKARKAGKPVLMVMDEAQHDAAESAAHLHNLLEPKFILGLTATPFRTDRMKLCFQKVIKRAGIHQLIQDGYLSRYNSYTIPKWTAESVADFYCESPEIWGKTIVYFVNKDECRQLMGLLAARSDEVLARLRERRPDLPVQRVAEFVDGDLHPDAREDQLSRFEAGETACLVNCMILTEGFDEPTLETAFVRDSSKGPTMQMAGRAFRQHPRFKRDGDVAFKHKRIVQSKGTHWPIVKTAMADQQFIWQDDQWRSLTINPHLALINHNARLAIAQTQVDMPKFITDKLIKRARVRRIRMA